MLYFTYKEFNEEWYYESDENGIVLRQIVKQEGEKPKLSNQRDSQFYMAEHPIDLEDSMLDPLQKTDFENEWVKLNADYMSEWEQTKKENVIGQEVKATIEVIYPQGIIVRLNHTQYPGLASYDEFAQNAQVKNIYPDIEMIATISGYDDINGWIKLENARLSTRS
ncbi:hypothetical protein [Paenibacillus dauci]|uniref:hypothetical protein n=1 Tax=Paenibacillus dauci TaxID=1567106 RepID=UPI000619288E|nr:hypothetical protein [Paenibacillus dauci]